MLLPLAEELSELRRQVSNLLQIGVVEEESKDDSRLVKVKVGSLSVDLLRATNQPKTRISLTRGDIVAIACPHGDLNSGMIVGTIPKPADGEQTSDSFFKLPNEGEVRYSPSGDVTIRVGKGNKLTVTSDTKITLSGPVVLSGDVTIGGALSVKGKITGEDILTKRGVSLDKHKHPESNGPTGTEGPIAEPTPSTDGGDT